MSDQDASSGVRQMGLSYITGILAKSRKVLLKSINENCPEIFDEPLAEFSQEGRRYILYRHQQKGYIKRKTNHYLFRGISLRIAEPYE